MNPNTDRIYVYFARSLAVSLRVFDGQTNNIITDILVGIMSSPLGVAVNPLTNGIYVAHSG